MNKTLKISYFLALSVLFSCKNTPDKEVFVKEDKIKAIVKEKVNSSEFNIVKLDSINNLYIVYAKKGDDYYKILSEKLLKKISNRKKIKLYKNYDLDVISIVPDTSKISLHLSGVLYKNTEIIFEKDSIWDLYKSPQLKGLYYIERE
jgi:hypothetical protein